MRMVSQNSNTRRNFLKSAGILLSLPILESIPKAYSNTQGSEEAPKRMIGICNNLGLLPKNFFPKESGLQYELSPYLKNLKDHKENLTVFSGVSLPGVDGSHASDVSFMTGAPHPGSGGFKNTLSLDQLIARQIGHLTRFPSLTLGVNAAQGRRSLSWTDSGVLIPCENSPSTIYKKLFISGSPKEKQKQINQLRLGQSIMDNLLGQSKSMMRHASSQDKERLDQYFSSIREVEKRLHQSEEWENRPKPEATTPIPKDYGNPNEYMEKTRLMYQMAKLAFESDSTRSITLLLDSTNSPTIKVDGANITEGYHNLSHHGRNDKKLSQLEAIDSSHMKLLNEFLSNLKASGDHESNLLSNTLVYYGSNLGDANKHTTDNMPVLVAGGALKHAGHLAFDQKKNYPITNLFVTMLQSMGLEVEKFSSSTGTMQGLEITTS